MIAWLESAAPSLTALALNYTIYSTIGLAIVAVVARYLSRDLHATRLLLWKCGLLAPLVLTVLSCGVAPPWLPVIELPIPPVTSDGQFTGLSAGIERNRNPLEASQIDFGLVARDLENATQRKVAQRHALDRSHRQRLLVATAGNWQHEWLGRIAIASMLLWILIVAAGLGSTAREWFQLRRCVASSSIADNTSWNEELKELQRRAGISRPVQLRHSDLIDSPMAVGCWKARIIVPGVWFDSLEASRRKAILAHELAHVVHRDPISNLWVQLVRRVFFFQPLNHLAARQIRSEAECAADRWAAKTIDTPAELAFSLIEMAEFLLQRRRLAVQKSSLPAGMSASESGLERRVATLLRSQEIGASEGLNPLSLILFIVACCVTLLLAVPRVTTSRSIPSPVNGESNSMNLSIARSGLVAGLLVAPLSPIEPPPATAQIATAQTATVETGDDATLGSVPEELNNFSGMLIGKLVDRDIERGSFTVKVDYVPRVWRNNKSRNPRAAVGKVLRVDGVTGKWLDQLLLVRPGETVEFEAQHRGGDSLRFPGEWLKKVPPFDASQHPVPPDGFRGFAGVVVGHVDAKDLVSHELILRVDSIEDTFEQNQADKPNEVVGKPIVVAGFWGAMSKPLEQIEKGDTIRAGVLHRVPQSDHFSVAEFAEKVKESNRPSAGPDAASDGFPAGMRGFRGILRGKLVSRDVEKGELVFRAERVTRTWKANRAEDTASCRGHDFLVQGVAGKWLDVLLTLEPGDTIEVEAFHNGGEHLDFIPEWLKKVE